jgi:hypothetical protein
MDIGIGKVHRNLKDAFENALSEALCSMRTLIPIKSIEVYPHRIVAIGNLESDLVDVNQEPSADRTTLHAEAFGNFHINIGVSGQHEEILGYLIVQRPLVLKGENAQADIEKFSFAIEILKKPKISRSKIYGPKCCKRCNNPIPQKRLMAVPNAEFCVSCKKSIERS